MDRQRHLNEARNLISLASATQARGQRLIASELVWGATVHAVSAADPAHETQPPDRFGNSHEAPITYQTFTGAAKRIVPAPLTERRMGQCFQNGQRKLHNHFYHLNLPPSHLRRRTAIGIVYAEQILQAATQSLET